MSQRRINIFLLQNITMLDTRIIRFSNTYWKSINLMVKVVFALFMLDGLVMNCHYLKHVMKLSMATNCTDGVIVGLP